MNKTVTDLGLPEGAILAMISRGNRLIAPRGATELRPNDHLFIIAGADSRSALDQAMSVALDATPGGTRNLTSDVTASE